MFRFILGLLLGSFLCLISHRVPIKQSIVYPYSYCDWCQKPLFKRDLIPVVSRIVNSKCRFCHKSISWRSTFVELLSAFYISYISCSFYDIILFSALLIIALIDYDTLLINNRFLVIIGCLVITNRTLSLGDTFIGFFTISCPLLILALLTKGMGLGDIKLFAITGAYLGPQKIVIATMIATISALVFAIIRKNKENPQIPFAPFISLGVLISWHYSQPIVAIYQSIPLFTSTIL